MKGRVLAVLLVLLLVLGLSATAYAHGVILEYEVNVAVDILAAFDSGEPMAEAQVTVYAPDDPSTPWLTGVCDEQGRFNFTPDPSTPGIWDVQVRHMGHGGMIHIPVGETMTLSGDTGYSVPQIALMAGCVIWGFIGTALFFAKKRA